MENKIEKSLTLEYVQAKPEDEENIRELLKNLGGDQSIFDISKFILAKNGEKTIGCVRIKVLENNCLELSSLAVDQEYQSKGIGSKLVEELLSIETSRPIFLLTSPDKEKFYAKFGFSLVSSENLPEVFKKEYDRVSEILVPRGVEVIAMVLK